MSTTQPAPEHESRIDALLLAVLEEYETRGDAAVEDACAAQPELATALRERIGVLQGAGLLPAPGSGGAARPPERIAGFRLLEELGRGGMGVVYLAEEEALARRVALKLIRPEHVYFEGARERFLREVRVVARLNHPGIAKVYSAGQHDGVPYFAMEFVDGVSLAQVVASLAERAGGPRSGADLRQLFCDDPRTANAVFDGSWQQVCARLVRQVADALEHAHRSGVLHRDVKPSNIMLTPAGQTLLLDFGLATGDGVDRLTRTGSQMGSVPYMPPEVVAGGGRLDSVALDIYSLGVTLYELLTLTLPFEADTPQELMRRVAVGRVRPPRALDRAVPGDLEVVCLAAMDPDPARRYPSAAALSRDLTNVLERRPIEARPAGPLLRIRRFVQRDPAQAAAWVLGVLLVVGAPIGFGIQQANARVRVERALALAEDNFTAALEAVEYMLERVGGDRLAGVPYMAAIRRDLLERAVSFYERFLTTRTDDAKLLSRSATAARRTATLLSRLGRWEEGLELSERAVAAARRLQEVVADERADAELAAALATRGALLAGRGQIGAAHRACSEAREMLDGIGPGAGASYQQAAGLVWRTTAAIATVQGDHGAAVEAGHRQLDAVRTQFAAIDDARRRVPVAEAMIGLAESQVLAEQYEDAERVLREARATLDSAVAADEEDLSPRIASVMCDQRLAEVLRARGADSAGELLGATIEEIEHLVGLLPGHGELFTNLSAAAIELAQWHMEGGRVDAAEPLLFKARDAQAVLYGREPEAPRHASGLAATYASLGYLHYEQQRLQESLDAYGQAIALTREVLAVAPERAADRARLSDFMLTSLWVARELGDHRRVASTATELVESGLATAEQRRDAADYLASVVPLAADDASMSAAKRATVAAAYAGQAIDWLLAALGEGAQLPEVAALESLQHLTDHPRWSALEAALKGQRK